MSEHKGNSGMAVEPTQRLGTQHSATTTAISPNSETRNQIFFSPQEPDSASQSTKPGSVDASAPATADPVSEKPGPSGVDYSVFSVEAKKWIILTASLAAFFSPLSSQIYFPALNTIAQDLHVSTTDINYTVTTYLIIQGIAPMVIAGFSDSAGRRPAYFICFSIYIVANLGLALQHSFPALTVLRCIQAAGSSGTVALSNGVVGDTVSSSERGKYVAIASLAGILGPTISPIIGGLISQYAGWKWIFWFLLILSITFFVPLALFFPETCRKIVHDGSVPPPKLNMSLTDYLRFKKLRKSGAPPAAESEMAIQLRKNYKLKFPNPLDTLRVVTDKESALILFSVGVAMFCFFGVTTAAAEQFHNTYGFDDLQIALMFIPIGIGALISAFSVGWFVDRNYARHAIRLGRPVTKNREVDLSDFPIERARLEVAIPLFYLASVAVIAYGWVLQYKTNLAGPVIMLFIVGGTSTAAYQVINILMVDVYPGKAATATAANNLVRCELGAVASAIVLPLINRIGSGWTFTLFACIMLVYSQVLWIVMWRGMGWRQANKAKTEAAKREIAAKAEGTDGGATDGEQVQIAAIEPARIRSRETGAGMIPR